MTDVAPLSFSASLADYHALAERALTAIEAGDNDVAWRFKWEHPRFRGKQVSDVWAARLDLEDAKLLVAQMHAFDGWDDLAAFTDSVKRDRTVLRFETAADAIADGDGHTLEALLREHPSLPSARSMRRHHATLLHYIAANGVEASRQRTPRNAVEIARLLLDAGADPNALADMYDAQCTTLSMLVSSAPPADAGLQLPLAELLIERGASLEAPGSRWNAAVLTALAFGYLDTARALAVHDGPIRDLAVAAGLGQLGATARLLPSADAESQRAALVLACMHGHARVARLLLDAGVDPSKYNPDGFHSHSTPLHQAVWSNREEIVRLLVERGARLDLRDTVYDGTPLDWAVYGKRTEIAEYLQHRIQRSTEVVG